MAKFPAIVASKVAVIRSAIVANVASVAVGVCNGVDLVVGIPKPADVAHSALRVGARHAPIGAVAADLAHHAAINAIAAMVADRGIVRSAVSAIARRRRGAGPNRVALIFRRLASATVAMDDRAVVFWHGRIPLVLGFLVYG